MRRVLTVLALFASVLWILADAPAPAYAQRVAAEGHAAPAQPVVIVSGDQYAGTRGLAVDAAGNLYISLVANPAPSHCVSRPTSGSAHSPLPKLSVTVFSNCASTPGESPSGIASTAEGRVFLANQLQNRIRLLDMTSGKVAVVPASAAKNISRSATSNLDLFEPAGLALDETRNLYVADRGNHRVLTLAPDATNFTYTAHILDAAAIAADSASGKLYVASPASNRVFAVNLASGNAQPFAGTGAAAGPNSTQFSTAVSAGSAALGAPEGVAVDGTGNVFIADTGANAIIRVEAKSGLLSSVALETELNSPASLAIDRRGNLFVADRGNHRVVEFPGIAAPAPVAAITISPSQFDFGAEPTGGTTAAQVFTLTNNSASALSLSTTDFSFTGANLNDFTQTNNCVPQLASGASCQINVSFAPQGTGARQAVLQVSDADPSSPQTAQVSGTGDDFQITVASGSTTQNVVPGNSATYNLQIMPDATFSGTVTPACPLQLPQNTLTCVVKPATLTVTAGQPAPFSVTIGTGGPNATAFVTRPPRTFPRDPLRPLLLFTVLAAMIVLFVFGALRDRSRFTNEFTSNLSTARIRARCAIFALAFSAVFALAGCYHAPAGNPNETPPGIFSIDISATAQNASRAITLTLNVD
ncbi:MAG TPA: choice-of-anchor D domain-containing protein [Candidatus Acidoferrales bacterium]|nr:choice-of-anchor D domain-containing protein [Candidatus Acidoferrales bacterium]